MQSPPPNPPNKEGPFFPRLQRRGLPGPLSVKAARDELVKRGAEVSEIEVMPWGSFVFFNDPDGNRWSLQQLPVRQ